MSAPTESGVPQVDEATRQRLIGLIKELAVVYGKVTLSSGREADYYIDLRLATLHHEASPLIGRLIRELTADWEYDSVGGLTLGADPVSTAVMHAPGRPVDASVVRKGGAKKHGMQKQVEGPSVAGRRVLVVEDTTTTGNSPTEAIQAMRDAGAEVVGVATIVDRETGADEVIRAQGVEYRSLIGLDDLDIDREINKGHLA